MNENFLRFFRAGIQAGIAGSLVVTLSFTIFIFLLKLPLFGYTETLRENITAVIFTKLLLNMVILYIGISLVVSLLLYVLVSYHTYLSNLKYQLDFYKIFYSYLLIFWVYSGAVFYIGFYNLLYLVGSGALTELIMQIIIYSLFFSLFGAIFFDYFWKWPYKHSQE